MTISACSSTITTEMLDLDQQLAQLLGTMTLQGVWNAKADMVRDVPNTGYVLHATGATQDECMSDSSDAEDSTLYQPKSDPDPPHPPSSNSTSPPLPSFTVASAVSAGRVLPGCGLLQAIQDQLCSDSYPTTAAAYLEVIFTHREVLYACPQLHRGCAMGFSELAAMLDRREWRADREGDGEAAAAFRHEAGLTAHVATAW